jgi:hypothetical protein
MGAEPIPEVPGRPVGKKIPLVALKPLPPTPSDQEQECQRLDRTKQHKRGPTARPGPSSARSSGPRMRTHRPVPRVQVFLLQVVCPRAPLQIVQDCPMTHRLASIYARVGQSARARGAYKHADPRRPPLRVSADTSGHADQSFRVRASSSSTIGICNGQPRADARDQP